MLENDGLLCLPLLLRELPLILKARRLLLLGLGLCLACCLILLYLGQAIDFSLLAGNFFLQSFFGFLLLRLQLWQSLKHLLFLLCWQEARAPTVILTMICPEGSETVLGIQHDSLGWRPRSFPIIALFASLIILSGPIWNAPLLFISISYLLLVCSLEPVLPSLVDLLKITIFSLLWDSSVAALSVSSLRTLRRRLGSRLSQISVCSKFF